jgi:CheY-like chemotaxis protein
VGRETDGRGPVTAPAGRLPHGYAEQHRKRIVVDVLRSRPQRDDRVMHASDAVLGNDVDAARDGAVQTLRTSLIALREALTALEATSEASASTSSVAAILAREIDRLTQLQDALCARWPVASSGAGAERERDGDPSQDRDVARAAVRGGAGTTRSAATPLRILVVDDHQETADSLALLLRQSGHEVRTVYNGRLAMCVAHEFQPDAVLMDIGMPGLNGLDAAREMRGETWRTPPVLVAISGWGKADDVKRAMAAGYDHHLAKPVDVDALHSILAGCTGTSNASE